MFVLSVTLFVIIAIMELFFKAVIAQPISVSDAMRSFLMAHSNLTLLLRGVLKILLGVLSAGTAFVANYYGSLALPQQIFDNKRMHALFESVLQKGQPDDADFDKAMRVLGRESLIESAGWYIAQMENTLTMFVG